MPNFDIYHLGKDYFNLYKDCFDLNGSPKNIENIEWQFIQNTEKKYFIDIAVDKDTNKTSAIYSTSCVKFKVKDELLIGAQSLDTITDLDYRGLGLFIKLAESVYQRCESNYVDLVYGFPNGNSIHGFEKKLEWKVLDPVPFLFKPLRSKYFTRRLTLLKCLPNLNLSFIKFKNDLNLNIVENMCFPEEVNFIWKKFSNTILVSVDRNKDYLDWRFIRKPNENYRIAHCYCKKKGYLGFIVFTVKEKHDGIIAYIMELIYDLTEPRAAKLLLNYAINEVKRNNADCLLTWCFKHSPNYSVFSNSFFMKIPEKLKFIELHFGVKVLNEGIANCVKRRENWYLSYSDSDTV